ncbi:MAG: bile acid:sodium symporter family protein [Luteolibacter sp.]
MSTHLTRLFPLWLCLCVTHALWMPSIWLPLNNPKITVAILGVVMLGMGLTLSVDDFRRIGRMPRAVITGFIAQFATMPVLAWSIGKFLNLPPAYAVGLILVGCCPGGTASNLITLIARANVALSVIMTACSTLAAVVLTPLFTQLLAGSIVEVNGWVLFQQTLQVVIIPVVLGVILNSRAPKLVQRILPAAPVLSVLGVCLICGAAIAASSKDILAHAADLVLAVFLLHLGGFAIGYFITGISGFNEETARTISIEVGMQNSGLAIVLAKQGFPNLPLAPVVGAVSAVTHSLIGSTLAAFWSRFTPKNSESEKSSPSS